MILHVCGKTLQWKVGYGVRIYVDGNVLSQGLSLKYGVTMEAVKR